MIHLSTIHKLVEGVEFSIEFIAEDGHIVNGNRCICTSFHSSGRTMTLKFCDSGEIRKVRRTTITKFNGQEVAL
jgi:hypothetical protein